MEANPATCRSCNHPADRIFEWAPGHRDGFICDCCAKKMWEETKRNVIQSLKTLEVRCPQ